MEVRRENRNIHDNQRRQLAEKYELKRKLFKAFLRDPEIPAELREQQQCKLAKLPRNSSFTRLRNRCIFTGRPRGVYSFFRMSRIVFRELANKGALQGIKKASW
ncbi:ribosomal protein S14, mitochondrial-like [Fagus crenata]|jgi:small subunit ribosomal protein S14